MLIDNKKSRYQDVGVDIKTVWEFIKKYSGINLGKVGNFGMHINLSNNGCKCHDLL